MILTHIRELNMATTASENKTFTIEFTRHFIQAVQNTFSVMLNLEVQVGKPVVNEKGDLLFDVSGIIGFSGDVTGSIVIGFGEETALNVIEAFVGERVDLNSEDFSDAVGELSNMIAGNSKKEFGVNASISIPSVIIGPDHRSKKPADVPNIILPFASSCGEFCVQLMVKQASAT